MSEDKKTIGPNMKKLIITKMSSDAIPMGGGIADGVAFLSNPISIKEGFAKAQRFAEVAIKAIRAAGEPNEFKEASDEVIAGEILKALEARKKDGRNKRENESRKNAGS